MDEKLVRPRLTPSWVSLSDGYGDEYLIDIASLTGITFFLPGISGADWVIWMTDGNNEWSFSYCDDRPIGHKEFQRDKVLIKKAWKEVYES